MKLKTPIRAGLAAAALVAVACSAFARRLGRGSGGAAAARRADLQQGRQRLDADVDRARSADDDPRPRAVLRRAGALQEHALGARARVLHGVHRHRDLGDLRLQPHLHRRLVLHRRPRQDLPEGRHHRFAGGDLLGRRDHPRAHLHRLPDDLRGDHAGADRRRFRRAHEVLRGGVVHPAVGDLRLFPDRPHGLVLGRPGRDRRRRQGAGGRGRPGRQGRGADQARRGHGGRRPDLPMGRDRLRRRHRGAHQRRHRRPRRRASWSASAPATARRSWRRTR